MKCRPCVAAVALATCASCASIVSKSKYPVSIQSEPAGMEFEVLSAEGRSIHKGRTPQIVTLDAHKGFFRRAKYVVRCSGSPFEASLDATLEPWYFGNIIFGGLIGILIVDPLTGAMWKLPDEFLLHAAPAAQRMGPAEQQTPPPQS